MPRRRYFSTLSKTAAKALGRHGGQAAWERGTPHRYTSVEGAAAGKKGGTERARKFRELRALKARYAALRARLKAKI